MGGKTYAEGLNYHFAIGGNRVGRPELSQGKQGGKFERLLDGGGKEMERGVLH